MNGSKNRNPVFVKSDEGRKIKVLGLEITIKLSSAETGGDYYVFESDVAPGDGVPPHVHSREDEILQVLAGELEVALGERRFTASAGAVAFFPRGVMHAFFNTGKVPAKARFIVSPGLNFERFFDELSALPADEPPDMLRVTEIFERYGLPLVEESNS